MSATRSRSRSYVSRFLRRPRFVRQSAALAALAVVLAALASSTPLFVQSVAEGAWRQDRERLGEVVLGATFSTYTTVQSDGRLTVPERVAKVPGLDAAVRAEAAGLGLGSPVVLTELFDSVGAQGPSGAGGPAQVISRDGADEHVRLVAGSPSADGALIPESAAQGLGASPGDVLTLQSDEGLAQVRVAGVYEDLTAPLPAYWQGLGNLFLPQPNPRGDGPRPAPSVLIMSQAEAVRVASELAQPLIIRWFFPLPPDSRLASAGRQADRADVLALRLTAPERPAAALLEEIAETPELRSALPAVLAGVEDTVALLTPPVRAVGVGGAVAALVLVGAWAGLRARRREPELRSLIARGLSPVRASRTALGEAAAPLLLGSGAGLGLALIGVRALGPAADVVLDSSSVLWAGGAALAAAATVGTVTAAATARLAQVGVGAARQALGKVPLVPVLTAVTVVAALPLLRPADGREPGVGLLALVVPLMVVVAASATAVGLLQRLAPRLRPRIDRLPVGPMLALRRVTAAPGPTRLVVVSTALALGVLVYAGALGTSTDKTIAVKAVVATGTDVVVDLDNRPVLPTAPAGTTVVRRDREVDLLPGSSRASLLAIDPARFADVAFWTDELADDSLQSLLAALDAYRGTRVPVIVAGALPAGVLSSTGGELTLDSPKYQVPVQVVGRANAWPGMTSTRPVIVAAQQDLAAALLDADREIALVTTAQAWGRGSASEVQSSLAVAGFPAVARDEQVQTAAEFQNRPALRAQTWALAYLRAVSVAAGALGLVGLGLHAASQQRRRTVATVLLTRMGLSPSSSRWSATIELALLGGLAALLGAAFTLPAARLLLVRLDPVPGLPPGPLFAVPGLSLVAMALAVAVAAVAGAAVVDRLARRTPGGEVMRGGE